MLKFWFCALAVIGFIIGLNITLYLLDKKNN